MPTDRPAVIVTGSSGMLGRPTCRRLAAAGYEVFGFDRVGLPEPPVDSEFVQDVECDLTNYSNVRAAVSDVKQRCGGHLASVVHLAAYYDFSGADSPLYKKVTVEGTDRLLNALSGFELEQFLFSSTMLIHAPTEPGEYITENSPLKAQWPYPQSKIDTERLIREAHPNERSVFLRIAGVYSEWGTQPTLVQQIKRIYEKDFESHFFPGDQASGQSSVHVTDAVDSILAAVERRSLIDPQTAVLIGESDPPAYSQLQNLIGQAIHGSDWTTMYVPPALAKIGAAVIDAVQGGGAFIKPFMVSMADDHYALDISRARELLGWQPKHRLVDFLPQIINKLLEDPQRWYAQNGLDPSEVKSR